MDRILNFEYAFKTAIEIGWAVGVAVLLALVQIVTATDVETVIADPQTWAIATAGALARAALVAVRIAIREAAQKIFGG